MLKKLLRNKKAQNTAEYAILISLVVAGIIAMQTYAQRALQGRVRDAGKYLKDQTPEIGNTMQYEPYYLNSSYNVESDKTDEDVVDPTQYNGIRKQSLDTRTRKVGGSDESTFNIDEANSSTKY
ncbi:MAG: hypothetical protein HQL23_08440 [Candidatus Omnitrophica bacterium]|nr:hypothetical protein [Candidatus Omnitrophota bacterium]